MKKFYSFLALAMMSGVAFSQTNVITETFSYPDATVLSTSNATTSWFQHSGTQGQILVNSGSANLIAGASEDVNKAFSTSYSLATANSSYKVEFLVDVTVLNSTGLTATGDYFISLGGTATTTNVTTGITSLPGRLYVKAGATGALFGTVNNSGTGSTPNYLTTEIPYNTPTNIKVTYEVNKDAANVVTLQKTTLQIGTETITNSTGAQTPPANIASIVLRQAGNATSGTGNIAISSITVNTFTPVLKVNDINFLNSYFIKNTLVENEISFATKSDIRIYNMNGQVVKSAQVIENEQLEVSGLKPGMYIVTGVVNGNTVSQKILKK